MLVLSRKCGEEIVIDGGVRIRVLQVSNGRVRIGIDAPDHVRIVRAEIEERADEREASLKELVGAL